MRFQCNDRTRQNLAEITYFRLRHGAHDNGTLFRFLTTRNCPSGENWLGLDVEADGGVGVILESLNCCSDLRNMLLEHSISADSLDLTERKVVMMIGRVSVSEERCRGSAMNLEFPAPTHRYSRLTRQFRT